MVLVTWKVYSQAWRSEPLSWLPVEYHTAIYNEEKRHFNGNAFIKPSSQVKGRPAGDDNHRAKFT